MIGITRILRAIAKGEAVKIDDVKMSMLEGLRPLYGGAWSQEVEQFCAVSSVDPGGLRIPTPEPIAGPNDGIFRLATPFGVVEIGVGTIHSVKGETLDAALVLTTFFYTHDLEQLLGAGLLCGRRPKKAQAAQKRLQENAKRIYVAMTRPTRLLCLAMCVNHVSDSQRQQMELLGWRLQVLG
jgi:hypothetical protein